jgi:outer membrane protein TolC
MKRPILALWSAAASRVLGLGRRGLAPAAARPGARSCLLALALAAAGPGWVDAAPPAPPDPVLPEQVDLDTAVALALQNNFTIREARERIRQQQGVIVEMRGKGLPNVAAAGSYQENTQSISQTEPSSTNFWQGQVTASQTLYAGGGVRAGVKNATLNRQAAVYDLEGTINSVVLDVRTKFYTVLLDQAQLKVQQENVALLQSQVTDASNRFRAGTTSSFDTLRAKVALANGEVTLITARNSLRIAIEQLRQSLGLVNHPGNPMQRTPTYVGELKYEATHFELEACLAAARVHRPELMRLTKLREAGEEAVTTAKSNYYPNLVLSGGWEIEKTPFSFTPGGSSQVNGWLVALKSQWNIFDGASTAGRVAQSRSLLEQSRLSLDEQALGIDVQVRQAFSSWEQANELDAATQQTVAQAEESLRQATARYDAGSATHLDVLQSQVDLTQARTNLVQAHYTYAVAIAQLKQAMGIADGYVAR